MSNSFTAELNGQGDAIKETGEETNGEVDENATWATVLFGLYLSLPSRPLDGLLCSGAHTECRE